ncbi:MAG TPA: APC family permease [Rhizomicrobium sp.]|nr:APC family permease [Rhizomicrobium sp.]
MSGESRGTAAEPPARALKRTMRVFGTLLLTLSSVTPASSVFVIVPGVISQAGSGAFLSMLLAAILAVPVAFIYAELSSAFPIAGGEYSIVARAVGPGAGFAILGVTVVGNMLAPAVLSLGASTYIAAVVPGLNPIAVAIAIIAVTTIMGVLHIRTNAWVTGFFLFLELLALAALATLGFLHAARPLSELAFHPVVISGGGMHATPLAMIGLATSVATFAYNGYGSAVYFAEEMHEAPRLIAKTILWALVVTVAAEFIPVTAVLLGAPDLKALLSSDSPFSDFVSAVGGRTFSIVVSLSIALAILNAVLATVLQNGRFFYSTGRDSAWHGRINSLFMLTHVRFHSPWAATLVAGLSAIAMCFIGLNQLLVLTGAGILMTYIALCIATLTGRWTGATAQAPYRMGLFPLYPVIGLITLGYVVYTNWLDADVGRTSLIATFVVMALSMAYYYLFLRRRGGWLLRDPEG